MKSFVSLFLLGLAGSYALPVNYSPEAPISYRGQKLVRVSVDEAARPLVQKFEEAGLDLWGQGTSWVDVRISSESDMTMLKASGVKFDVLMEDIQEQIDYIDTVSVMNSGNADLHDDYHTYDELKTIYSDMATERSNLLSFTPSIGKTTEGRDIFALNLKGKADGSKKIYYECGIHAREWISPAMCLYLVDKFTLGYGTDTRITNLMDTVEFVIVPSVNPDGYVFSWDGDRMWRKNRATNKDGSKGVDLNRNFDTHWASGGSSSMPRSDTYHGPSAGSEPEVKTVTSFINSFGAGAFLAGIDFHSYSQLILRPWGWTKDDAKDEQQLFELGAGVQSAIKAVHGTHFENIKSIELYVTTGTANDWFYDNDPTMWGYTIELRDTGRYGFLLPPDQIKPSGEELIEGFKFFAEYLVKNHA